MTTSTKPSTLFWVVSILALLWNLMGVFAFAAQMAMTPEMLQALPADQRAVYENTPAWATIAFGVAVIGGALGCILLLIRKRLAIFVLTLSLLGIIVQMIHSFFISNSMEVFGPGSMIMPVMVILIGIYLVWFSRNAAARGWLR